MTPANIHAPKMKIFGPVLGAILAAAAIIAVVVSVRNQSVKTEQAEKALDESIQRAHAILGIYSCSRP